jgi:hypothetical protein
MYILIFVLGSMLEQWHQHLEWDVCLAPVGNNALVSTSNIFICICCCQRRNGCKTPDTLQTLAFATGELAGPTASTLVITVANTNITQQRRARAFTASRTSMSVDTAVIKSKADSPEKLMIQNQIQCIA